jgi:hypothetical protein
VQANVVITSATPAAAAIIHGVNHPDPSSVISVKQNKINYAGF